MEKRIKKVFGSTFENSEEILEFYKKCLPDRLKEYRLDEVGPIMSRGTPEEIEGYLRDVFSMNGVTVDMSDKLNWFAAPDGDLEWNGGLVRQGYLLYLADSYQKTNDEIYAKTIIRHMLDYIRNVPPFNPEGRSYLDYKKSTWRPFEVAGRAAENWPVVLSIIINSPSLSADDFFEIVESIHLHGQFLRKHHWQKGNHAAVETAALAVISMIFLEFTDAESWLHYAIHILDSLIDDLFYPDGYSREMSGAYHWVAIRNYLATYRVALNTGCEKLFSNHYINLLYRSAQAEFLQQKPDFSCPVTNDSNVGTNHEKQLIKLKDFLDKEILRYRITNGKEGTPPDSLSVFFENARLGIFRSHWSSDAVYASFDMGPYGTNHMNEDQLNFELSAYGRNLLVNCGRWRYTTSPYADWLDRAQYFKSTAAYNSVLCDGYSQMPGDAQGFMHIGKTYDYAYGEFTGGYGPQISMDYVKESKEKPARTNLYPFSKHTREIFYIKPNIFIVRDSLQGANETMSQVWHLAETEFIKEGSFYRSNFIEGPNVIICPLKPYQSYLYYKSQKPWAGYNCPSYDTLVPAGELHLQEKVSKSQMIETLIIPVQEDELERLNITFNKIATEEEVRYLIDFNNDHYEVLLQEREWKLLD